MRCQTAMRHDCAVNEVKEHRAGIQASEQAALKNRQLVIWRGTNVRGRAGA